MMPQSRFMILAPVDREREAELRRLLSEMNAGPGQSDPNNALIAFGQFEALHFARLFILDDQTLQDVERYGMPPRTYPLCLVLLGDVDGEESAFLDELARRSEPGLRAIFSCCGGFSAGEDLSRWMKTHSVRAAAGYQNWKGRTLLQIREEAALEKAVERYLDSNAAAIAALTPRQIHLTLRHYLSEEIAAARLAMTPESPTRFGWWMRDTLDLVAIPALLVLLSPLLLLAGAVMLLRLRLLEVTDPEICPPVDPEYAAGLALLEDRDVTNQFTAVGSLKPGLVRRWTASFVLWILAYAARHVYIRGRLARVDTIHFARWVWLDRKQRMMFASNYDGSLESYMDDFINKVAFGLNAVFSNGIGYPKTTWLLRGGALDEQKFKNFLRRHELPTEVWYNAHPGLTTVDLERNARIRRGLESPSLTDRQAAQWLAYL
jgi:hypothetical protein